MIASKPPTNLDSTKVDLSQRGHHQHLSVGYTEVQKYNISTINNSSNSYNDPHKPSSSSSSRRRPRRTHSSSAQSSSRNNNNIKTGKANGPPRVNSSPEISLEITNENLDYPSQRSHSYEDKQLQRRRSSSKSNNKASEQQQKRQSGRSKARSMNPTVPNKATTKQNKYEKESSSWTNKNINPAKPSSTVSSLSTLSSPSSPSTEHETANDAVEKDNTTETEHVVVEEQQQQIEQEKQEENAAEPLNVKVVWKNNGNVLFIECKEDFINLIDKIQRVPIGILARTAKLGNPLQHFQLSLDRLPQEKFVNSKEKSLIVDEVCNSESLLKSNSTFLVTDNLDVIESNIDAHLSLLHTYQVYDMSAVRTKTVQFGAIEIQKFITALLNGNHILQNVFSDITTTTSGSRRK